MHDTSAARPARVWRGALACALIAAALRLAVILYRSRRTLKLPALRLAYRGKGYRLEVDGGWLAANTLVAIALEAERGEWDSVGLAFEVQESG